MKENFPEMIWYIRLKCSEITEIVMLLQYSEILASLVAIISIIFFNEAELTRILHSVTVYSVYWSLAHCVYVCENLQIQCRSMLIRSWFKVVISFLSGVHSVEGQ